MPSEEIHHAVSCKSPGWRLGAGGRKAWDRTRVLAVEWGAANVRLSLKKKNKTKNPREKLCSICIPLFCVCGVDKAHLPQPMPQRVLEVGFL